MKSSLFTGIVLTLASAGLGACGSSAPAADAATPGVEKAVTVSDGRLVLPAVKGNPAAVYFTVKNGSDRNLAIEEVAVAGAGSAMMHATSTANGQTSMSEMLGVQLPQGQTVEFKPGGMHVMAMDLKDTVTPGSQTQVTLDLLGGDKVTFPAEVKKAGDER